MKIRFPGVVLCLLAACVGLVSAGCGRLLPARKGTAHSLQLVIDTRRAPSATLSGTFIPGVYPAITKIPIVWAQKVPLGATYTGTTVEVLAKEGEMKVLESVIEDNQVYLKCSVPTAEGFSSYNVLVRVNYEYR